MSVSPLTPQDIRKRELVRISKQLAAFSILLAGLYTYLGISTQDWYNYLSAGAFALSAVIALAVVQTRYEERQPVGGWHLVSMVAFTSLIIAATQSNVGAEIGLAGLVAILVIVLQAFPPEHYMRGVVFGAAAGLGASFMAFFSPFPQRADATADLIVTWVARGSALLFLGLLLVQFRTLKIGSKLLTAFLGVVVLFSMTFNIVMAASATQIITTQVGEEIQAAAQARGTLIGDYVYGQIEILQTFALDETIRQSVRAANALKPTRDSVLALDEQWQQAVASDSPTAFMNSRLSNSLSSDLRAFQSLSPEHVEVFVTDRAGALVATTNITSDYYQADEGWWSQTYNDGVGDVYISQPQFDESAGTISILLAVPIYDTRQGDLIGIMRSTLSMNHLISVLNVSVGETGVVGTIFPGNPGMVLHKGVFEEAEPLVLTNIVMLEQTKQSFTNITFRGEESIFTSAPVRTITGIPKISQLGWKAVIHQQQSEALAPVREQVRLTSFFGTLMAGVAALLSLVVSQRLAKPISGLTETANKISEGELSARAPVESQDEVGQLAETFNTMTNQLQETLTGLEDRVAERTAELEKSSRQLEKRAGQFEAIAQLARTISSIQDLGTLLPRITQMVSQQFGFYHVGLFLLDESRQIAVLSAANSEGGQRMLARKHHLGVGQSGIVGYVTGTGNPRIALDTGTDAVFFDNPDLPETRSEMALPMRIGRTIIGALDVQSTEPNAFSEDDVEVLSILADEVSVAIENARLYEESQRALTDAQSAFGEFTKEAWQKLSQSRKVVGYELSGTAIRSLEEPVTTNGSSVSVPIKLRDQVIGTMNIGLPENKELEPDEIDITQALAERVGTAIESAALLEESRRRANRESVISDISAKLSSTAEIERLMQIAVGELRDALGASEVAIKIGSDE